MANITVGQGMQFSTISQAVAASKDGDVIQVQAGTYTNDFATINTDVTLEGVGGMVKLVATSDIPNGKGILVTNGDVTISNFEFSGAQVSSGNGAGIRYEDGDLVVKNSYFHDNQNGILANPSETGTVTIANSEFDHNGSGDGYTHNLYVGDVAKLTVTDSYFHDAVYGHEIKSRAEVTEITGNRIYDENGNASYSIDLPNGGKGVIANNIIQQGANSANPNIVAFGAEGNLHADSQLTMSGNTIVNELAGKGAVLWNASNSPATLEGNEVYGANQMVNGSGATESGTTTLASAPSLDTSQPWSASGAATADSGSAAAPAVTDPATSTDAGSTTNEAGSTDAGATTDSTDWSGADPSTGTATDTSTDTAPDASADPGASTGTATDAGSTADSSDLTDTDASGGTATDTSTETPTDTSTDASAGSDASTGEATDTGSTDPSADGSTSTGTETASDDGCGHGQRGGWRHEYLTGVDGDDKLHFGGGHDTQAGGSGEDSLSGGVGGHDWSHGLGDYVRSLVSNAHDHLDALSGAQSGDVGSTADLSASVDGLHPGLQGLRHGLSDFLLG